MSNCKNCGNPIQSHSGRRPREFCDNNQKCRNEWFRKNKKVETHKIIPMEEWKEIKEQLNKVSLIPLMSIEEVKKMIDGMGGNRSQDDIERELGKNKPQETSKTEKQANVSKKEKEAPVAPENSIEAQIEAIKAENVPPHRNTAWGKKSWQIEQDQKIAELEKQLAELKK